VSAEWLAPDQGSGNRTVDVQIPDIKRLARARDVPGTARIESAGQRVSGAVGAFQRLLKRGDTQHG
jgi:hypothetical protein